LERKGMMKGQTRDGRDISMKEGKLLFPITFYS
jgi:hypothetical protein